MFHTVPYMTLSPVSWYLWVPAGNRLWVWAQHTQIRTVFLLETQLPCWEPCCYCLSTSTEPAAAPSALAGGLCVCTCVCVHTHTTNTGQHWPCRSSQVVPESQTDGTQSTYALVLLHSFVCLDVSSSPHLMFYLSIPASVHPPSSSRCSTYWYIAIVPKPQFLLKDTQFEREPRTVPTNPNRTAIDPHNMRLMWTVPTLVPTPLALIRVVSRGVKILRYWLWYLKRKYWIHVW